MSEKKNKNEKQARAQIRVEADGPFVVTGGISLSEQRLVVDSDGLSTGYQTTGRFPREESYRLCRCGQSCSKPFCDGSHTPTGFDGTETAAPEPYLQKAERTVGAVMDLEDIQSLCASARFCDRAGGVWDAVRASDDPARKALALEEAGHCPAGRLSLKDKSGRALEPEFGLDVVAVFDTQAGKPGPLWIRGGVEIVSADGHPYAVRNRVTLCRCGKSENKPFCDGKHVDA